ncbi:TerB family tellurite resistance protein [Alphaproteobacteria bacterium]|nr:TerB family tellurite resistance protein [Alphaproteobacteria bacterium]
MFSKLSSFFSKDKKKTSPSDVSPQLYKLIYEIIAVDNVVDDIEIELTSKLVNNFFGYNEDKSKMELIKLRDSNHFNPDLTKLTYDLKHSLSYIQRLNLIEICWQVLLVDNREDVLETSSARKISVLLGVEDNDFISIRNRVKNSQ